MFRLREALPTDVESILDVAGHLDSVNLPHDEGAIKALVAGSVAAFSQEQETFKREYLFVLEDLATGKVVGTSMIHAQHGTRRSPHVYFDITHEEHYSETLDRHFEHRLLRIGYNYNGPTEIGGLVLQPALRTSPERLGKQLSYVRFLFIGAHRDWFRSEVISELMPPLEEDGTSLLWEALGRRFTGLSYQEADRISSTNKEFIRTLFPQDPIYTCLLPAPVQAIIGVVGEETRGVEHMLRKIGFQFANRIDPFDGGPHFIAKTDEITLVRQTRHATVFELGEARRAAGGLEHMGLVAVERAEAPRFVAVQGRFLLEGTHVGLEASLAAALGVVAGDRVIVLPFEEAARA